MSSRFGREVQTLLLDHCAARGAVIEEQQRRRRNREGVDGAWGRSRSEGAAASALRDADELGGGPRVRTSGAPIRKPSLGKIWR